MPEDSNGYLTGKSGYDLAPSAATAGIHTHNATNRAAGSLDTMLPPFLAEEEPQKSHVAGVEARDYVNGGFPHELQQSALTKSAETTQINGILKQLPIPCAPFSAENGGTTTPPSLEHRRSVAFAGPTGTGGTESQNHTRNNSIEDDADDLSKDRRGGSLMAKLKALKLPVHTRTASHHSFPTLDGSSSNPQTPSGQRATRRVNGSLQEIGSDSDADAEETADENVIGGPRARKRRRTRRQQKVDESRDMQDVINSPPPVLGEREFNRRSGSPLSPTGGSTRFHAIMRRTTGTENDERLGMSEGEGRDHLHRTGGWHRGGSFFHGNGRQVQTPGYFDIHPDMDVVTPTSARPRHRRRATGQGGGVSESEALAPRMPRLGSRAVTYGAARWEQVKQSLKTLGARRVEHPIDYLKSAELMAELRAGAPAALMLASMIQRDERGNKRIPVLLEQLKVKIVDSRTIDEDKDKDKDSPRQAFFRIELEYGSGEGRMRWVVHRSVFDFIKLHSKYKLQATSDALSRRNDRGKKAKRPSFPTGSFPYARRFQFLGDSDDEGEPASTTIPDQSTLSPPSTSRAQSLIPPTSGGQTDTAEKSQSDVERPGKRKSRRPSLNMIRRRSTAIGGDGANSDGADAQIESASKRAFAAKQRRVLEQYLQEMIRWLIFRADSNRLCKFLELSALGVRLSAEGGYHGKEGFLSIANLTGGDIRRHMDPSVLFAPKAEKWFLVRSNYIACVDSPENMHIFDVFLLDPKFTIQQKNRLEKYIDVADASRLLRMKSNPTHHKLKIQNSERRIKLLGKSETIVAQFAESIRHMMEKSLWSKPNRFDSFAPIRHNVFAQWLVDGRDYMWNVSRAINEAKDVIYIHDWWLSPQLYMRRPAAISQKWRLDRLLRKKAAEGVKIFVIVYRNVEAAVPIDSEYTKFCLLDLHPNIFVQRSPNQFKKNQFFYAHHEKICIVDHSVAFVGGIDLCFGRWDTPQHSVTDDKPTGFEDVGLPKDSDHCQLWPGKDYSNPRVQDFYDLHSPYAEMYDRSKTPRMPWHDISMQVVGQPARDLTRHFVQRWNYVLRGRKPTRPTPFLLPPPDYLPEELENIGLTGTCEVQILRSASNWSLGIQEDEHSIMNAYCKMIEESEHFVYIENQFFITSTETMDVKIVNKIGDALVERAVRAYKNGESWRCVIIIPLMPGFQNTVDAADGTSVRLIMQCQFRSICRGEDSIFARLRHAGTEPEDFISFYSLRAWGKIGPNKTLVTEQLYIHAKVIIVDDRIALIGSANINERSMLGSRDSETAAVVRDTDMLWSFMDGQPYLVGRFAHTLRMRLMREHLGLDVDAIMEEERDKELDRENEADFESNMDQIHNYKSGDAEDLEHERLVREAIEAERDMLVAATPNVLEPPYIQSDKTHIALAEEQRNDDVRIELSRQSAPKTQKSRGRDPQGLDTVTEDDGKASSRRSFNGNEEKKHLAGVDRLPPAPAFPRRTTEQLGLPQLSLLPDLPIIDDTDIGGPAVVENATGPIHESEHPLMADLKRASITKDCMRDPLNDAFYEEIWRQVAENNTKIFRRVFRCNPDSEVVNWAEYTEFQAYAERFAQSQNAKSTEAQGQEVKGKSGPPGSQLMVPAQAVSHGIHHLTEKLHTHHGDMNKDEAAHPNREESHPTGTVTDWAAQANREALKKQRSRGDTTGSTQTELSEKISVKKSSSNIRDDNQIPAISGGVPFPVLENEKDATLPANGATKPITFAAGTASAREHSASLGTTNQGSQRRRRRGTIKSRKGFSASDDLISKSDAEALLSMVQGSLVLFPYDWLKAEEHNNNWLYQVDLVAPLQIYD